MQDVKLRRQLSKALAITQSLEQSNKLANEELGSQRHKIAILEAENAELLVELKELRKAITKKPTRAPRTAKKTEVDNATNDS